MADEFHAQPLPRPQSLPRLWPWGLPPRPPALGKVSRPNPHLQQLRSPLQGFAAVFWCHFILLDMKMRHRFFPAMRVSSSNLAFQNFFFLLGEGVAVEESRLLAGSAGRVEGEAGGALWRVPARVQAGVLVGTLCVHMRVGSTRCLPQPGSWHLTDSCHGLGACLHRHTVRPEHKWARFAKIFTVRSDSSLCRR